MALFQADKKWSPPVSSLQPLLSLRLSAGYPGKPSVLRHVTLEMQRGEILGLVGESGSGKSTLGLAVLRLLGWKGGSARGELKLQGRELMALSEQEMRELRGRQVGLVLQSPLSALNPALRIGTQLGEAWKAHADGPGGDCKDAILSALASVSLVAEEAFLRRYPAQLSVGQAQRVLIAMAILHRPALLVADEPTSALDVVTQSEILELFARLNRELEMGILYISHDLLSVASLCHRIAILHDGHIIECGPTEQIFRAPQLPYTRQLIRTLPKNPFDTAGHLALCQDSRRG
jgi:ABC-type dipeptide/oligopeptide/nickel transport system ATPase component